MNAVGWMRLPTAVLSALLLSSPFAAHGQQFPGLSMPSATPAPAPAQQVPAEAPANAPTQPATTTLPMLYPGEDFVLGPGDLINVQLFGSASYTVTARIAGDGTVTLPYIGIVRLAGLSVRETRTLIENRLRTGGFYRNPEIVIEVMESLDSSVTLTGEIKTTVPVTGSRRLIDVLAAAGGLPSSASHTLQIVRLNRETGQENVITVNLGANPIKSPDAGMLVYPRDIIQIPRVGVVYAIGAFRSQGRVEFDQQHPLTLMQLAAMSGGTGWEGRFEDLRLIRTEDGQRTLIKVDLKKVLYGKIPDPVLQPNDIVFLPTNSMKGVLKNLGIGGIIGLVSLLITIHNY